MKNKILHIGAGPFHISGLINSDKHDMDVTRKWPYPDNSIDGVVSMSVLQELTWRELVFAVSEMFRVLKVGGVARHGVPVIESRRPMSWLLGWTNQIVFSKDLIRYLFVDEIGFTAFSPRKYRDSKIQAMANVDNRASEHFFFEVIK